MDRLQRFEEMLASIEQQDAFEQREMERLKADGKEKSATYRQYFGNRLLYKFVLEKYKEFGLR